MSGDGRHTAELLAALKLLIERSGHMSPFGAEISVKSVRRAGEYMEALEIAEKLIAKVEASTPTKSE